MKKTNDRNDDKHALKNSAAVHFLLAGMLTLIVISILILSWVPPVSRDALTHHLAVPKLYLQHGGIYEIPSILFSYYPMNLDLLYVIPLYFGNDIFPKWIHFAFALLTAGLIYGYLKKRLGAAWALSGAIFFLSLPIIIKLSITVYVDLGIVFFSTAALLSLLKWVENRFQLKFLILSAICCGLALGTKYNGLIVLLILTLFVPLMYVGKARTVSNARDSADKALTGNIQLKALASGVLFVFIALLIFSPWMIRNFVWKANPIYPLYDQVFNPNITVPEESPTNQQNNEPDADLQPRSRARSTSWGSLAMRRVIYGESWWEIALIPVRIFFQGQDDSPKHFDGKLNPFLLLLPIFAFFKIKGVAGALHTEKKLLLFFALFYVVFTLFATHIRIRYIVPIIPPLVILSMFGVHAMVLMIANRWKKRAPGFTKAFILFLAAAVLSYNGIYIVQQFHYVQPFTYLSGLASRDAYIEKYRPEYPVYQYANLSLPERAKILGLFLGNRRYYCDRELIFGQKEFQDRIQGSDSTDKLIKGLQDDGYTHLMIRFDLFNQWMNQQFDDRQKEMLQTFFTTHVRPILSKNGYGLFQLISKGTF